MTSGNPGEQHADSLGGDHTGARVGTSRGGPRGNARPGGANLPALRDHNTALVLGLLRAAGPQGVSRLELAEHAGLTPQAVSKITARLREAGLAAEAGRRASTGGKPRTVLRLVPGARHAVGLHLDRDESTAVLADLAGEPVAVRTDPLAFGAGAETVLDAITRQVDALLTTATAASVSASTAPAPGSGSGRAPHLLGVGVAAPGPLDHEAGMLHRVTGFPQWDGFPLRDALAARLGLPVVLDKDTNAAALGPAQREHGGGSFAYLHLGTGLGAGLVLNGTLYRGVRTGAGEFGHQVLHLDGPPCDCGKRGCVEALCLAAVARGDLTEAARVLGVAAANLVELLDIDRVLLGGRTVLAHPSPFLRGVEAALADRARTRGGATGRTVPTALAPGGPRAVADGAAHLVLSALFTGSPASFAAASFAAAP
ncbi:ROK family transcriptional regulator [Streptomyces sp. MST-110588]|uniref:ROK family transcriptional regulator n=1 Tax=Streptomyces sp. MST-110588 TaxID=2833628 RepID=UPI001F5D48E3|nr:ROK family transcriptional regulator [Streptomyces sp. MST-110588]UNO41846.1 ROK family transcriptional regulator [Streptomyces sp. MST-110588]